jgi:predicted RNA-binding protein YlxR (DUF448 family)
MSPRTEPERTCVACREKAPKRSLLRIARGPAGGVVVDPSGRTPGRGAYIHRDETCAAESLRRGRIARALGTGLSLDEVARLTAGIEEELTTT